MKNCLIFGSGRSGTSMLSGILYDAGYYMGKNLYPPSDSNPKGFFENLEINGINEIILSKYDRPYRNIISKFVRDNTPRINIRRNNVPDILNKYLGSTIYRPSYLQRWLVSIPVDVNIICTDRKIAKRIRAAISYKPFCYKDPRIGYTLPVWKKQLSENTVFICIFREPDITIKSILNECASRDYLRNLQINESEAYEVWMNLYLHILKNNLQYDADNYFFVHYNQIFDGSALPKLSKFLEVELNHDFVSKELKRTQSDSLIPDKVNIIYNKLRSLSKSTMNRL